MPPKKRPHPSVESDSDDEVVEVDEQQAPPPISSSPEHHAASTAEQQQGVQAISAKALGKLPQTEASDQPHGPPSGAPLVPGKAPEPSEIAPRAHGRPYIDFQPLPTQGNQLGDQHPAIAPCPLPSQPPNQPPSRKAEWVLHNDTAPYGVRKKASFFIATLQFYEFGKEDPTIRSLGLFADYSTAESHIKTILQQPDFVGREAILDATINPSPSRPSPSFQLILSHSKMTEPRYRIHAYIHESNIFRKGGDVVRWSGSPLR